MARIGCVKLPEWYSATASASRAVSATYRRTSKGVASEETSTMRPYRSGVFGACCGTCRLSGAFFGLLRIRYQYSSGLHPDEELRRMEQVVCRGGWSAFRPAKMARRVHGAIGDDAVDWR